MVGGRSGAVTTCARTCLARAPLAQGRSTPCLSLCLCLSVPILSGLCGDPFSRPFTTVVDRKGNAQLRPRRSSRPLVRNVFVLLFRGDVLAQRHEGRKGRDGSVVAGGVRATVNIQHPTFNIQHPSGRPP